MTISCRGKKKIEEQKTEKKYRIHNAIGREHSAYIFASSVTIEQQHICTVFVWAKMSTHKLNSLVVMHNDDILVLLCINSAYPCMHFN